MQAVAVVKSSFYPVSSSILRRLETTFPLASSFFPTDANGKRVLFAGHSCRTVYLLLTSHLPKDEDSRFPDTTERVKILLKPLPSDSHLQGNRDVINLSHLALYYQQQQTHNWNGLEPRHGTLLSYISFKFDFNKDVIYYL